MDVRFFRNATALRRWFERNHAKANELQIGFYKKASGKPSVTYREALDEALCFGWIDGIRRNVDGTSYTIRFTPRRRTSNWSLVNIKRVEELKELGLMRPAGLAAFEWRDHEKAAQHTHARANSVFDAAFERRFKANRKAWAFFQSQPAGYRRLATWFVVSAKKPETRERRLAALIEDSAAGRRQGAVLGPGQKSNPTTKD
jgi:uncharacterized protein YdeI (YjbR/CyaY-like superfamily)